MSKVADERSKRLKAAINEYEVLVEAGMFHEAMLAKVQIQRTLHVMCGEKWNIFILAKHGMKSAIEQIRSGKVKNCSIGPDGSIRCHALPLVP